MKLLPCWLAGATAGSPAAQPAEPPLPLFDAHLHYSHDAWERLPPKEAVALMREAGLRRAMVSSSSDEGTQKLYAEAPDLVLPVLRPYRTRGEISSWMHDSSIATHLETRLAKYRYVAIGEYHIYGADADLPVVRRVVQLARQHLLFLHSHSQEPVVRPRLPQRPCQGGQGRCRMACCLPGIPRPLRAGHRHLHARTLVLRGRTRALVAAMAGRPAARRR